MKYQTVTFSRLVSGPGYSNTTIGVNAILEDGEAPENALAAIEGWVQNQHNLRRQTSDELATVQDEYWTRKSELRKLNDQIAAASERWEMVKDVSAKLGIDLTARLGSEVDLDDVPF